MYSQPIMSPTRLLSWHNPYLFCIRLQVLLVDDASSGEWLGAELDIAVANMPKVRLLRLEARSGLIRAKVAGAHAAKGDVLTFLDR